jgi:hypothetical protein
MGRVKKVGGIICLGVTILISFFIHSLPYPLDITIVSIPFDGHAASFCLRQYPHNTPLPFHEAFQLATIPTKHLQGRPVSNHA